MYPVSVMDGIRSVEIRKKSIRLLDVPSVNFLLKENSLLSGNRDRKGSVKLKLLHRLAMCVAPWLEKPL